MLELRHLVTVGVMIIVVSVIAVSLPALNPKPPSYGNDSYGVTGIGHKGIFEILAAIDISTTRSLRFPTEVDVPKTFVLLDPRQDLMNREPTYLHQLAEWASQGGRLITMISGENEPKQLFDVTQKVTPNVNGFTELGLPSIRTRKTSEFTDHDETAHTFEDQNPVESIKDAWTAFGRHTENVETIILDCVTEGTFASWSVDVRQLALPDRDFHYLEFGQQKPDGVLSLVTPSGEKLPVIAEFKADKGISIISTAPFLLDNRVIAERDNPVLAAYLLAGSTSHVLFDEFYHGLAIQGQPLWLLQRYPYGLVVILIGVFLGLTGWRSRMRLGPIIDPPDKPRRSIAEYVSTMGALLLKTRDGNSFALRHLRENLYWIIGYDLAIPGTMRTEDHVMMHLRRKSPDSADAIRDIANSLNELIELRRFVSRVTVLQLLQRFSECRSKLSTIQSLAKSAK